MKDIKNYLHYENWTEDDVKFIAKNYSNADIYDFIYTISPDLESELWADWDTNDEEHCVRLFLSAMKYPSIAMRELDAYVEGYHDIMADLERAYWEFMVMGDESWDFYRESFREDLYSGKIDNIIEGLKYLVEEREDEELPETKYAIGELEAFKKKLPVNKPLQSEVKDNYNPADNLIMERVSPMPIITTLKKDNFYVDIILNTSSNTYYAWLYHNNIGVKDMMFGSPVWQPYTKEVITPERFIELVEANVDQYIPGYIEDYMNE